MQILQYLRMKKDLQYYRTCDSPQEHEQMNLEAEKFSWIQPICEQMPMSCYPASHNTCPHTGGSLREKTCIYNSGLRGGFTVEPLPQRREIAIVEHLHQGIPVIPQKFLSDVSNILSPFDSPQMLHETENHLFDDAEIAGCLLVHDRVLIILEQLVQSFVKCLDFPVSFYDLG